MFVMGTTEIQFIAYLQLIRNRLILLNSIILQKINAKNTSKSIRMYPNFLTKPLIKEQQQSGNVFDIGLHTLTDSPFKDAKERKKEMPKEKIFPNMKSIRIRTIFCDPYDTHRDGCIQTVIHIQNVFMKLEKVSHLINSCYGLPIMCILVIKFTTLTSLLYFCCMIIIKCVSLNFFNYSQLIEMRRSVRRYLFIERFIFRITSGQKLNAENKDQLFSSSGWIAMHLIEVFILSYTSSITKREAHRIACNLHRSASDLNDIASKRKVMVCSIFTYHQTIERSIKKFVFIFLLKIIMFSMHLLQNRIEFIPLGLFCLDLSFVYTVCTFEYD